MIALGLLCLVLLALLVISRREVVRLERYLVARDATLRSTTTKLAVARAARLKLEQDPRVLLRLAKR